MNRREFGMGFTALGMSASATRLRAAAFRADVTPALGEPLIWIDPARKVLDPLWAKGVVLEGTDGRAVVCAMDWCGVGGSVYEALRAAVARGAGAAVANVALVAVHQHAAPYVDGGGYGLMGALPDPPLMMSGRFLETIGQRLEGAAAGAVRRLEAVDAMGVSEARVEQVASARRMWVEGKLVTRFSSGAKDPALAALPEGDIDARLRTVTLYRGGEARVRIHHYACHPQTFCCNGEVSGDFVSAAREQVEREEGVPQIYLTGCAGDITAGKYNDGSEAARRALAGRLAAAMRASNARGGLRPLPGLEWKTRALRVPGPAGGAPRWPAADLEGQALYRHAIRVGFARRREALEAACLRLGSLRIVFLPGEPMLAFQPHAPETLVAGYGDISPGYLCPDAAFEEGGYEPSAAHAGPGTEAVLKSVISELVAR